MRGFITVFGLFATVFLVGVPCAAQTARDDARSLIQTAHERIEEADFEAALEAIERAGEGSGLTRADVVTLLVSRALVHHALRNTRELETDFFCLASLEPTFSFDASVPPDLQERFTEVSDGIDGPMGLTVEATEIRGGFRIDVTTTHDSGDLIQSIRIFTRIPGGEWVETDGARVSIPVGDEGAVEYYVRAFGPGESLILEEGSETAPLIIGDPLRGENSDVVSSSSTNTSDDERRISTWVWIGTAVGVLAVAAAVVTAVLLTQSTQETQMGSPGVEWP